MSALPASRISLVVLTHNRRARVLETLAKLRALPERCPIWVVDNGSCDGTSDAVRAQFSDVHVVRLPDNRGAAGRNAGVAAARTPYVAFCDDDTWWAPGALTRAVALLDAHPRVAVLCARVLVGADERLDPTCHAMAHSPARVDGLPGPLLLGYLAGACVMRRDAFLAVGGYDARLFLGAEEALVALDLAVRAQWTVYAAALTVHHHPAPRTDSTVRRRRLARNAIWVAWLRRPPASALRESWRALRRCASLREGVGALRDALSGLSWVLRERQVIPLHLDRLRREIDQQEAAGTRPLAPGSPTS
jgi:GT2 family glycosyltransferase